MGMLSASSQGKAQKHNMIRIFESAGNEQCLIMRTLLPYYYYYNLIFFTLLFTHTE